MFCRIEGAGHRALQYEFPFEYDLFRLSSKLGLLTPYDSWELDRLKQLEEDRLQAEADREFQEKMRLEAQKRQQIQQQRLIENAIRKGQSNLVVWRKASLTTPHWHYLQRRYHLSESDLAIWDLTLPGYRFIKCDPRLWIAHLYYETVYNKFRDDGLVIWPRQLANWHLREKFGEYIDLAHRADPRESLNPLLNSFITYLHQLGIVLLAGPNNPSTDAYLFSLCSATSLDPEKIARIKAELAQKELEGFKDFLQNTVIQEGPELNDLFPDYDWLDE
jgi:hypothetical protein